MHRTQALVVALCLAFAATACQGQGIISGPLNDAVYATSSLTIRCQATPGDRVQWHEYVTNPNGIIISDGDTLVPSHPNFARYTLDADLAAGTYDLTISDTVIQDGGVYECSDENTGTYKRAQLVIIAAAPNCTTTIPANGIVIEGVRYTIECNVYFGADANIVPLTTWSGPGVFNQLSSNQTGSVLSGIGFDVQKVMDAQTFRMLTNFTQSGFGGVDYATNVPEFQNIYTSLTLFVRYPPQNVSYAPVKSSYEIGDTITCYSDAVPIPTYVWTDLLAQTDYVVQTLTITESMAGPAIFRCQITNIVGSANIFVNTTVNPRTTPTTPTTTPTTTPVPAVSNCQDITGRWEFSRAADSKAVLCLYVDGKNNGFINGLFWNDTKTEAYYMDIVGRTRNNIYDETGLVGIWPLNVGVSAFALECHRCFGEETLLVNIVSRSSQEDEFCGDGGNILEGPQYTLKRVDWAYPCGPPATTSVSQLRAISREAALKRKKRQAAGRRD